MKGHKKLHPQRDGVLGHEEWDIAKIHPSGDAPSPKGRRLYAARTPVTYNGKPVFSAGLTNALCPKSAGGCPSPPTREWSFPPTSN
ncbi:MAG: hypothetical protein RMX68_020285 [Aulosira sp. ZfuVER01]|nr:hypothetical protein [Aulosira sp. DedVER01a]MDZ8054267.1 hypothetical protein [Aulosira sp. ZfuCHP01]